MHDKLVILGYPRSGTKLLADAFVQNGYHNFGEFINTFSSEIVNSRKPYAKRMDISKQKSIQNFRMKNPSMDDIRHSNEMSQRVNIFNQYSHITPSIITIWPESFSMVPGIMNSLKGRMFLCTRRKNKYEQFLSRLITYYSFNYDENKPDKSVTVDMDMVDSLYISFLRTERIQDDIVQNGLGQNIDFDELIMGKSEIGFNYQVTSEDQHDNLKIHINNLKEVNDRIQQLQTFMGIE